MTFPGARLIVVLLASVMGWRVLLFTDEPLLKLAVALPLLLLLPGYVTVAAIFPQQRLGVAERLLFSLAISIGFVVIIGLLLHVLPSGLQQRTWAVVLMSFILLMAAMGRWLFRDLLEGGADSARWRMRTWRLRPVLPFRLRELFLLGLAVAVVVVAFSLARTPASKEGLQGYTMFWIIPGATGTGEARFGVRNMEFIPMQYRLQLEAGDRLLLGGVELTLRPGETRVEQVLLPADYLHTGPITINLYRLDAAAEPYRYVTWWPQ